MSALADELAFQLDALGLSYVREHRFAREIPSELSSVIEKPRQWRFDFCFPEQRLAVEVEGGVWSNGRHNRGKGFIADCEKYNAALLLGWRVLRIPSPWVRSGIGLKFIEAALTS